MNERIRQLALQARLHSPLVLQHWGSIDALTDSEQEELKNIEKFANLIIFDILGELTNDDNLGSARIITIERLAKKFGVNK